MFKCSYRICGTISLASITALFSWVNYKCIASLNDPESAFLNNVEESFNVSKKGSIAFCKASYALNTVFEALTVAAITYIVATYIPNAEIQIHPNDGGSVHSADSSHSGSTLQSVGIDAEELPI